MGNVRVPKPVRPLRNGKPQNVFWIRKKVPLRLRALVGQGEVWRSLDTTDLRTATARCAAKSLELEQEWAALAAAATAPARPSAGPVAAERLPHRDLIALAGVHFRNLLASHQDDPGMHLRWASLASQTRSATNEGEGGDDAADAHRQIEDALDGFISHEGLTLADGDRERLRPHFVAARLQAFGDLQRAARGDYTPSPEAARFPERVTPKIDLIKWFETYSQKGGLKGGEHGPSAKRWRPKIKLFCDWLGHRDLARMTTRDGYRWADHLIEQNFDRKSIKNVWLAALSATAGFVVERQELAQNPFHGIRVREETVPEGEDAQPPRQKGYSAAEAIAILGATLQTPSHLASIETAAARRWLPWLCAYSGARVNEITSLYPRDITQDPVSGMWCMIIKPSLEKTVQWRTVPIHSHVIEQGFLSHVESQRAKGLPLFYDPGRSRGGKIGNPQFKKAAERLAEWLHVQKLIPAGVQPNHAWRHLFKSMSRHVGMRPDVEGFITGHRPKDSGSSHDYGDRWIATMSAELEKYPRYKIAALSEPPAPHRRIRRTPEQIALDTERKLKKKKAA